MHDAIMAWSSHALYGGRLTAHGSVAAHTVRELPGVDGAPAGALAAGPLVLVDTAGCDMEESLEAEGGSR